MTALTSLYPDEAARAVRAEAALPGTYAEVAARSGLTEEQAMAALHVLRGAGRVVLDRGVFSRATPEQILLAGLGRGTPELRARVLKELPGNAVAIAARLGISDWLALSVLGGLGRDPQGARVAQGAAEGLVSFSAKVIKDSVSPLGVRLTTLEIVLPRFVAVDFNTHRALSRNGASSRAIPIEKRIAAALENPFIPARFTKNGKGMTATEYLTEEDHVFARSAWLKARDNAVASAREMLAIGVHKGLTNRVLEPYLWHTILVSATEWSNYDALRCHPEAQDEMRIPSEMAVEARAASTPSLLQPGEWHLPYVDDAEARDLGTDALPVSVGRCARISTLTHDGKRSPKADIALTTREIAAGHMSPAEHVATPVEHTGFIGNFRGWKQLRKTFANEHDFGLILAARGAS